MDRSCAIKSVEGDVVLGVHGDTAAVSLSLVERISDTLVVVVEKAAVLHELNNTIVNDTTTLRVGVHDGDLESSGGVLNGDSRLDGVVVVVDLHVGGEVEVWTVVTDTLLHLKTVGIGVESVRVVVVIEAPLGDDLCALVVNNRDLKHLDLELDVLRVFSKADECLINSSVVGISVDDSELTGDCTGMNLNRLEHGVEVRFLVSNLGDEDVGTTGLNVGEFTS